MPGWLKLILKVAIAGACIWYISGKINYSVAGAALQRANWLFLLLALVAFVASKLVSAIRLNIYFANSGCLLTSWQNIRLYWLGMLYNMFLPGSIGGDAYKVMLLNRRMGAPVKRTTAAVLLDRFSGLLGLGLILAAYASFSLKEQVWIILLPIGAIAAVFLFYLIIKKWFPLFLPGFYPTLLLGLAVQLLQVICVYLVMMALDIRLEDSGYIFIFLVSSAASVLPLTIGGLGIREIVFLEGSGYFGLLKETSVVISILFFLISVVTAAGGLIYVFKDPLQKKEGPGEGS